MLYHFFLKENYFSIKFYNGLWQSALKLDLKIKSQLNEKFKLADTFHTSESTHVHFSSDLSNDKARNDSQLNLYPKAHYKFVRLKTNALWSS